MVHWRRGSDGRGPADSSSTVPLCGYCGTAIPGKKKGLNCNRCKVPLCHGHAKGHRCRDVSGLGVGGFNDLGEEGKVVKPGTPAHIIEIKGGPSLLCLRRHFFTLGELTQRKVVGRSAQEPMTYEELKAWLTPAPDAFPPPPRATPALRSGSRTLQSSLPLFCPSLHAPYIP